LTAWPDRARFLACLTAALVATFGAVSTAQDAAPTLDPPADPAGEGAETTDLAESREWPRWFEANGHGMLVYAPQVDRWHDYTTLSARAAVAVYTRGADEPEFGAIRFTAPSEVDFESRTVAIGRRTLAGSRFPDTDPDRYAQVRDAVDLMMLGNQPLEMTVDEIVAYLELEDQGVKQVPVDLDPPPLFWSQSPAILVLFAGEPRFETVADTGLMACVNASWDLFLDLAENRYYLLFGDGWITSNQLEDGTWTPAHLLPPGLSRLPAAEEWAPVRALVPGVPPATAPRVLVHRGPADLIVTDGSPEIEPIEGSPVQAVVNTDNDLFVYDGTYYLLSSGRWFRAESLAGPWSAATADLPAAFATIPADGPYGAVLSSVPGTTEAKAAVLLASIPRTATIRRDEATIEVAYDGEPRFVPVEGSEGVQVAVNTNDEVFLVEGGYYCCYEGVWFNAASATGPWTVCDRVPMAIYTIPTWSPHHRVTYVEVQASSDDTVTVSQSAGYTGEIITMGLVIAGLGYAISQADSASFRLRVNAGPITVRGRYRSGERYDPSRGGFVPRPTPYGAYGRVGGARSTGRSSPRSEPLSTNPYRSWGTAVVPRGQIARAGGGVGGSSRPPARRRAAGDDVYAGFDGNVYRRTGDGRWQQRGGDRWGSLDAATAGSRQGRLDRQHRARSWGTRRASSLSRSRGRGGGGRRR
jgi:hypothetical protein